MKTIEQLDYKEIQELKGLIVTHSILKHQRLTKDEEFYCRDNMELHFQILDKMQIPFKIQNIALYLSEKYDTRSYNLDWYIRKIEKLTA